MAEILAFPTKKEPTLTGPAVCLACGENWQAVCPVGSPVNNPDDRATLECPRCHALKGVFTRFVQYTDVPSWHCTACQGFLFSAILAQNVPTLACAACGHLINALDLFNDHT